MEISRLPLGPLMTNCYVVTDEEAHSCAVIDPGGDGEQLAKALKDQGLTLKYILLTHGHYDHVGGVRALHEATGAPVYLHEKDLALPEKMTDGPLFWTDHYKDGDTVTMDHIKFEVIETPGHTPGSVCLLAGDAMFSGDTLFQGSCGRMDFPGGSEEAMAESMKRIQKIEGDYNVYPGHGGETTLDVEKKYNPYLRSALK